MRVARMSFVAVCLAAFSLQVLPARADSLLDTLGRIFRDAGANDPTDPYLYKFQRQRVTYPTREAPGTIIIDTSQHYLFYVLGKNQAIRYGVGVGREGFGWHGTVRVGRMEEWPDWRPPPEMIVREREHGRVIPAFMKGGSGNPLGARALYLFNASGDTQYRIHGTSEPWTIGRNVSSGCIRLINADVMDLYRRAKIGAKVIVL